ncbi:thioesterase II family protein [Streptomyces sp. TS71-3]|uniref:thioesterase II family protein n=1 Tax=Streptomyces sp. TS71-3 TaxID=2733862 RepID=UPI001B182591|nr:thioesterase [Streptomyces sp. TS71-3]GHJ41523.1 thioesterase [Streptomyces sp. TS71-3]
MPLENNELPLVCLPFAGGGASFFHPWNRMGLSGVVAVPLQLPGRERRLAERPYRDLHAAADGLLPATLEAAAGGPVALFGHCFLGAVLAYELARRLTDTARNDVVHLFVSAARPPTAGPVSDVSGLTDDAFLAHVEKTTGYRHAAFDSPELRELLLPALRADFAMDEGYTPLGADPLDVPVTAVAASDDSFVSRDEVARWADMTTAGFSMAELPGEHMYLADDPGPLLELISATVGAGRLRSERPADGTP